MHTTEKVGVVRDWHDPRNDECQHNAEITTNCTCKRIVNRKPYRVCRVTDNGVNHNVNPRLIIEVHPNGTLVWREAKRRKRYYTTASDVYSRLVRNSALAALAKKRAEAAARRKARKQERRKRR